jgi:histidinol-phosphate aminotransferase
MTPRPHGGPDAHGAARWDFSTCSNAAGPCAGALAALRDADPTRYPDPAGSAVRHALADLHGVAPWRILPAASASEFIQRITAVGALLQPGAVQVPPHAYGDYAAAAVAWRRPLRHDDGTAATLRWWADPSSPLGQDAAPPGDAARVPTVLDAAYAPLRLQGPSPWTAADREAVFVLHSPNKALGLTGVRGAYAVAPQRAAYDVEAWCHALAAAAPSWPWSAQAEALLRAWATASVQGWVQRSHAPLAEWRAGLAQALAARGFALQPSVTPFFCVRSPQAIAATSLRAFGVSVRDTTSFGLPGWWRVSAQPSEARQALVHALDRLLDITPSASEIHP